MEIPDLKISDSNIDIIDKIKEYGFVKISRFLDDKKLKSLRDECEAILKNTSGDTYNFGEARKIGPFYAHKNTNKTIYEVFSDRWMIQLSNEYFGRDIGFNELFLTHEFKENKDLARNGFLHFDRIHTFKFMIYLTDVTQDSGPLSVVPKSRSVGKNLRESAWEKKRNNEYDSVKNRIFLDYNELGYSDSDVVPVTGDAGTLIIFDTDTFHLGGVVKEGNDRMIIRSHMRV